MNAQISYETAPMIQGMGFYKSYDNQKVIGRRQETRDLSFEELVAKRQHAAG